MLNADIVIKTVVSSAKMQKISDCFHIMKNMLQYWIFCLRYTVIKGENMTKKEQNDLTNESYLVWGVVIFALMTVGAVLCSQHKQAKEKHERIERTSKPDNVSVKQAYLFNNSIQKQK